MSGIFKAQYAAVCKDCEEDIYRGDYVCYVGDRLVHENCAEEINSVERHETVRVPREEGQLLQLQRPVCPKCFIELPKSMICGSC
jgi:hypothetical protein